MQSVRNHPKGGGFTRLGGGAPPLVCKGGACRSLLSKRKHQLPGVATRAHVLGSPGVTVKLRAICRNRSCSVSPIPANTCVQVSRNFSSALAEMFATTSRDCRSRELIVASIH